MNVRALVFLTIFAAVAASGQNVIPAPDGSQQGIQDQPSASGTLPPEQPAATLPGASTPESGSRSNAGSARNTPAANPPLGHPIPLPPIPMSPDRADDSYAIYSLLMPGSYLLNLGPEHNQAWLVADATITRGYPSDRVPSARRCIQPPTDRTQDFRAVFEDFDKHAMESIQLDRNFQVQIPYRLLSEKERNSFSITRSASGPAPDAATADAFRGAPGITYFSQVYFNLGNTLALVYMQEWCGPKCGQGQWIALEKVTGGWVRRNWNVCSLAS
ncbi:MAG TPA: hypothetical protein VGB94_09510 [Acidobacteriaceae bacterium]